MKRRGFTLVDVGVVIVAVLLLIGLALAAASASGGVSRRAACAKNLRAIGQACKIYANDFADWWPVAPHHKGKFLGLSAIGTHRQDGDRAHADPSIGQSLFILVRMGSTTFRTFVCPGRGCTDKVDSTANPMPFYDFMSTRNLSYGYQYPYGPSAAKPHENRDPGMPMLADKCFTSVGFVDAAGRAKKDTDFNKWGAARWKACNSVHHQGEGQNVLFLDGHVAFERTAACGPLREAFPRKRLYPHKDLIYENADGVFGGDPKGWPLDAIDSVIAFGPPKSAVKTPVRMDRSRSRTPRRIDRPGF